MPIVSLIRNNTENDLSSEKYLKTKEQTKRKLVQDEEQVWTAMTKSPNTTRIPLNQVSVPKQYSGLLISFLECKNNACLRNV